MSAINQKNENNLLHTSGETVITEDENDNPMNRQTLPKWLVVWWWIAMISVTPLYLLSFWEDSGWTLIHNYGVWFLLGIIGYMLILVWLLVTGTYLLVKKKRLAKSTTYYLAIPLIAIALRLLWTYLGGGK